MLYIHRELYILTKFRCEFILEYKEAFYDDATSQLVMVTELCENGTLEDLIENRRKKNLPLTTEEINMYAE